MTRAPGPGGHRRVGHQPLDQGGRVAVTRSHRGDRDPAAGEWDTLAAALEERGIKHLSYGRRLRSGVPRTARELFARLARAEDPRLQEAGIVLLLTHPHLADEARLAISSLEGPLRERAMRRYVAAAALQRMARTRIALALGQQPDIPPAYLDELQLPPLDQDYGRETLLALAADEEARCRYPAWPGYLSLLDLFLNQIRRKGWGRCAKAG